MDFLFIEGDSATEIGTDWTSFAAHQCLEWYVRDCSDAEKANWTIVDDIVITGIHFVQLSDLVEGDSAKFFYRIP